MWFDIFRIPALNHGKMDQTISAIDTIALRIPLDIWAPEGKLKQAEGTLLTSRTKSEKGDGI